MNVREIVASYLKANGFDGLYSDECGCLLDDLMPCSSEGALTCKPGYKRPCPGPEGCDLDGGCKFHIGPERPVRSSILDGTPLCRGPR